MRFSGEYFRLRGDYGSQELLKRRERGVEAGNQARVTQAASVEAGRLKRLAVICWFVLWTFVGVFLMCVPLLLYSLREKGRKSTGRNPQDKTPTTIVI